MTIKDLTLSHFRSYQRKTFSLSSQTAIFGPNASGKTNILEAIFLLATGKSFRAESDREMISFGGEVAYVKGEITKSTNQPIEDKAGKEEIELEMILTQGVVMSEKTPLKKYAVNKVPKRMIDFVGNLRIVLFWPQDMELITGSPGLRRRYLDFVLIQVDREYRRTLLSYDRAVRQRNKILEAIREAHAHRHQLMFWDQLIIKNGEYITKKREEYIEFINKYQISQPKADRPLAENYQLFYDRSTISEARLEQYKEEEVAAGVTLVGPHRDDLHFSLNSTPGVEERDLAHFGSRGEQRLAVLWLKLGELAYVEEKSGEKPVLLLDDIFSELDHEHHKTVINLIGNQQTIITFADWHFLEKKTLQSMRVIDLSRS